MFFLFVERDVLTEIDQFPVDPRPHIARLGASPTILCDIRPYAPARSAQGFETSLPSGSLADSIHHLLNGLRRDFLPALKTEGAPDARIQQTQVVVNLGDRADGGSRIVARALLLDRNRRREPLDGIDVRLPHLFQKLAGIGGERFDIASLPFGVNRVEGQGRLARPAQAGDDDELVPRDLDIEILEIVLPRPFDDDGIAHKLWIISAGSSDLDAPADREIAQ